MKLNLCLGRWVHVVDCLSRCIGVVESLFGYVGTCGRLSVGG